MGFRESFYRFKYNTTTKFDNISSYIQDGAISAAKNSIIAISTIVAKSAIHFGRFVYDAVCDIGNMVLNTVRTPEDKHNHYEDNDTAKTTENVANNDSLVKQAKDFVTSTWQEKDDTYIGEVSRTLGDHNYALAKLATDVVSLGYNIAKTVAVESSKVPVKANSDGFNSAYKAGYLAQTNATNQSNITSTEVADGIIKLDYTHQHIQSSLSDFIDIDSTADMADMIELQIMGDQASNIAAAAG